MIYYDFDLETNAGKEARKPTSKVYLPVRHFKKTDLEISKGVDTLLESFKNESTQPSNDVMSSLSSQSTTSISNKEYTKILEHVFPTKKLETNKGLHTYVCIGMKKDGRIDFSSYLNPQLFSSSSIIQDVEVEEFEETLAEKFSLDLDLGLNSNSRSSYSSSIEFNFKPKEQSKPLLHPYSSGSAASSRGLRTSSSVSTFNQRASTSSYSNSSVSLFSKSSFVRSEVSIPSSVESHSINQKPSKIEHSNSSRPVKDSASNLNVPTLALKKKSSRNLKERANSTLNKVSEFMRKRSNSVKKP